ncbi:MAG: hypothetical protein ABW033_08300 [Acidimicrobiia bacterium]
MVPPLAVSVSSIVLITIAILSVVVLVLIVIAPWKRVREEPPLDKDVETRLLLHRPNPEEATGEIPTTRVADLSERTGDAPAPASDDADFAELRDLDD